MYRNDRFELPSIPKQWKLKRVSPEVKKGSYDDVSVDFHPAYPISKVDIRYLSLSIDISVLAGGFWWEGSQQAKRGLGVTRIQALDLDQSELHRYVEAIAPFYLRIGGSEADKVSYLNESLSGDLHIDETQWDSLHQFIEKHNLKLFFTAKYGLFRRGLHGAWEGRELEELLDHSVKKGFDLDVVELGNELNAYWIFHGFNAQPGPKKLAKDYRTFSDLVRHFYPKARICGPGSAFWPKLGEAGAPFSNLTRRFLEELDSPIDIIDWHYYPFQSRRSPLRTCTATLTSMMNPKSFLPFEKYTRQLMQWRDQYHPQAELWTGESGSAQCGGQQGLSDRWVSSFWWADQLGLGAQLGQQVMIRQSLVGGDYGLLDRTTLTPRPDYWICLLWAKLMGDLTVPVHSNDDYVRVYCHSSKDGKAKTLLVINLSPKVKKVESSSIGEVTARYELTADSLEAKDIYINEISSEELNKTLDLDAIPCDKFTPFVKGHSISFWTIKSTSWD